MDSIGYNCGSVIVRWIGVAGSLGSWAALGAPVGLLMTSVWPQIPKMGSPLNGKPWSHGRCDLHCERVPSMATPTCLRACTDAEPRRRRVPCPRAPEAVTGTPRASRCENHLLKWTKKTRKTRLNTKVSRSGLSPSQQAWRETRSYGTAAKWTGRGPGSL